MQFYYFKNKIEIITIIICEESLVFFFFSYSASRGCQQSLAHGSFFYNPSTPAFAITDDIRVSSLSLLLIYLLLISDTEKVTFISNLWLHLVHLDYSR